MNLESAKSTENQSESRSGEIKIPKAEFCLDFNEQLEIYKKLQQELSGVSSKMDNRRMILAPNENVKIPSTDTIQVNFLILC